MTRGVDTDAMLMIENRVYLKYMIGSCCSESLFQVHMKPALKSFGREAKKIEQIINNESMRVYVKHYVNVGSKWVYVRL